MGTNSARFGISGLSTKKNIRTAGIGVAGINTNGVVQASKMGAGIDVSSNGLQRPAVGVAGLDGSGAREAVRLHKRDEVLGQLTNDNNRLGDRAARDAWHRGVWFADFTYITTPYQETENGGYVLGDEMRWRNGRELTFSTDNRSLPLFIDSCGYRRELTGTAPNWAKDFEVYPAAIELIRPEGYASWDYPRDRSSSMEALYELMRLFPQDVDNGRLWPVFSIRWTWDDKAHLGFGRLPGWSTRKLAYLIPLNRTQRQFKESTRERWARQAIANALTLAADPDFRMMVDRFGRVMLGGMVGSKCPRMARHIFTAVLCELFPDVQFWLLGQANFATINGLGMLGLLDQVWTDGTWWLKDATCERFAYVEDGLITMHSFETNAPSKDGRWRIETFFTLTEMMAANLRSLLAAYEGLWSWPPPEPLPLDLLHVDQAAELKRRYQAAQLELGI